MDGDLLAERIAGVDSAGNPLPIDQVINPFGDGTAQSPAAMAGLVRPFYGEGGAHPNWNYSWQDDYILSLDGSIFSLPGGEVRLAVGGENRTETLDYSSDQSRSTLFSVTDPERKINSYFAELGIPLVGDNNRMGGVHSLGMKLALRSDEYSFSGPFGGPGAPYTEKTFDSVSPKLQDVSVPGATPNDLHGTVAGPERWKGNGYVNWAQGNATLNLTANYSSSYSYQVFSALGPVGNRAGNYLTFDLTGSYEFGDSGWKVYAGARNITNKEFPFYDSGYQPWDPRRVDPRGRVVHLEIRKTYNLF